MADKEIPLDIPNTRIEYDEDYGHKNLTGYSFIHEGRVIVDIKETDISQSAISTIFVGFQRLLKYNLSKDLE